MGLYRNSRNLELSIIQYTETQLAGSWSNVTVEKSFARCYSISLPVICIRCGTTLHNKVEIGSNSTIRNAQILIDIFASDDGNRLDLKDFLIGIYKAGCVYYEYAITNGVVSNKTAKGRIRVLKITDEVINFNTSKDELDVTDRHRHLITLGVSTGKAEV